MSSPSKAPRRRTERTTPTRKRSPSRARARSCSPAQTLRLRKEATSLNRPRSIRFHLQARSISTYEAQSGDDRQHHQRPQDHTCTSGEDYNLSSQRIRPKAEGRRPAQRSKSTGEQKSLHPHRVGAREQTGKRAKNRNEARHEHDPSSETLEEVAAKS